MYCAVPLLKLLFSSPMANLSNTKAFSHTYLKLSLSTQKQVVAGGSFYLQSHPIFKLEHVLSALANVDSELSTPISSAELQIGADLNFGVSQDVSSEDSDVDEKEKSRSSKFTIANKGITPWNIGNKHSPDGIKHLNVGEFQEVSEKDLNRDEKEKLRRLRISKVIKGRVPWNKGKKHSPETLQRIRERTKITMQSPKMKEYFRHKCEKIIIQKGCLIEWQNVVAEAARVGLYGDEELQWDTYELLLQEELQ